MGSPPVIPTTSIVSHSLILSKINFSSSLDNVLPITLPLESQHILHFALQFSVNNIPHELYSIFLPSPSKNINNTKNNSKNSD